MRIFARLQRLLPLIYALPIGCLPTAAAAAHSEDGEAWGNAAVSGPIATNVQLSLDTSVRLGDGNARQPARVIRPMIGYQASKRVSLWVGYTRVEQFPHGHAPIIENRLFEQLSWNAGRIGIASVAARTRLEQRFFESSLNSALRVRQLIKIAAKVKGTKINVIATTEPFITLRTDVVGAHNGLEQWRNSISVALPLCPKMAVEVGYLNRYIVHDNAPDGIDHIVPVTLSYHF